MFEQPLSALCAVYWTGDLAATARSWTDLRALDRDGLDPASVSLNAYEAVMERLTMIEVREPTDEAREKAAQVRRDMGDRVLSGPPAGITSEHFG